MAMINTSESMRMASTVLGERCDQTQKDMKTMMSRALCQGAKLVSVVIPRTGSKGEDVVSVGLNGVMFYFRRGTAVKMPANVAEVLYNTGVILDDPRELLRAAGTEGQKDDK